MRQELVGSFSALEASQQIKENLKRYDASRVAICRVFALSARVLWIWGDLARRSDFGEEAVAAFPVTSRPTSALYGELAAQPDFQGSNGCNDCLGDCLNADST